MIQLPGYVRLFIILLTCIAIFFILIAAKSIFIPIILALILAFLMKPFCSWQEKFKIPRGLSAIIAIIVIFAILFGLFFFISIQVRNIARDLPEIGQSFTKLIDNVNNFLTTRLGFEEQELTQYLKDSLQTIFQGGSAIFSTTVSATTDFFTEFTLVLLSLFFFLYYRRFFLSFLKKVTPAEKQSKMHKMLSEIEYVVRSYILGLLTVIFILAVLNTTGLMIFGIDYALFFGLFAAMLTIIPYLGVFIGSILPILFALITKDSLWYPIGIAGMFWVIQFLEGNFITPNIIGNRISVNPFAIIVALFVGGMMWGPVGMILSVPGTAILKVFFSNTEALQPYGFLLGNPPPKDVEEKEKQSGKNIVEKVKEKLDADN